MVDLTGCHFALDGDADPTGQRAFDFDETRYSLQSKVFLIYS